MVVIRTPDTRGLGQTHVEDNLGKILVPAHCRQAAFDMCTVSWRCEMCARLLASYVVLIYCGQDKALSHERKMRRRGTMMFARQTLQPAVFTVYQDVIRAKWISKWIRARRGLYRRLRRSCRRATPGTFPVCRLATSPNMLRQQRPHTLGRQCL